MTYFTRFRGVGGAVRRRRTLATALGGGAVACLMAGMLASSSGASGTILPVKPLSPSKMASTILEAFGGKFSASKLQPIIRDALNVAGTPATPAEVALAAKCIKETTCNTGHGNLKIGIFDPSGTSNPWRAQARTVITLQALRYPQVKTIVWADGGNDNLTTTQAAYRGLISQKVNVIIGNMDQGNILLPITRQAARAGIIVIPYSNVIPAATGHGDIAADVTADLCGYGTTLGKDAVAGKTSGTVAIFTGTPGNPFGGTWEPCTEKAVKAAGLSYTLGNTNWTPQGEAQAAAALAANPGNTVSEVYDYLPDGFFQSWLSVGKEPPTQVGGSAAYSTVALYQKIVAKYPNFKYYVSESELFFPAIAATMGIEKALGAKVPLHILAPQTVVSLSTYLPYYKAHPGLPAAAQFSTMLPDSLLKATLGG